MITHTSNELSLHPKKKIKIFKRLLLAGSLFFVLILTGTTISSNDNHLNRDTSGLTMLSNPAAVYCQDMGYEYETLKEVGGERGVCHLPEETTCGAWEYLEGSCGQEYSYCAQQGYQIKVQKDGNNTYSSAYGVCVTEEGEEIGSVVELSQLTEKALGCQGEVLDVIQSQSIFLSESHSHVEFIAFIPVPRRHISRQTCIQSVSNYR